MADKPFHIERFLAELPDEIEQNKPEQFHQPYTEEEYDKLKDAMLRVIEIIERGGVHSYMVRGGFAVDLLGKEFLNRLAKLKAYDVDFEIPFKEVDIAVTALSEAGFALDEVMRRENGGRPIKYRFIDPQTKVLIDIFPAESQRLNAATKFQIGGSEVFLENPVSLNDVTRSEAENRLTTNTLESNPEQRRMKVLERAEILKLLGEKLGINYDYFDM